MLNGGIAMLLIFMCLKMNKVVLSDTNNWEQGFEITGVGCWKKCDCDK